MTSLIMGRYELLGLLGSGGIGQVYAAQDQTLGRPVAIKALRPEYSSDRNFLERFHAEAASLARLSHPNITTLYDLQADGQQLYMIMELVRGHTLEAVLTRQKRLGARECLAIAAQTIAGLEYAHRTGVIHRDVKPSNLMLTESGTLKIMDFGIARVRGSQRMTRTGSIIGTLAYVAPEQIKGGGGDERSDLYSLACVLYEILSGVPPFSAETEYDLIRAQVETPPERLVDRVLDLPEAMDRALVQALAKDPAERFESVEAFGRALGTGAVVGQSADILREAVSTAMGCASEPMNIPDPIPPPRWAAREPELRSSPPEIPRSRRSSPGAVKRHMSISRTSLSAAAPIVVLGAVAAALALGLGYIALDSEWRPKSPESALVTGSTSTSEAASAENSNRKVPPSDLILPSPDAASPARSIGAPSASPPAAAPASGSIQSAEASAAPLPRTDESPAYEGRVADWPGPNLIAVPMSGAFGLKFLKLYGILDTSADQASANADHRKLKAFLANAGDKIVCYARGEGTFQCYANRADIALWAVQNGLARPSADAPKEYLDARQ